jgi:hypothetical protein
MSGRPIAQAEDCMDAEVSRRAQEHEHAPHMSRVFAHLIRLSGSRTAVASPWRRVAGSGSRSQLMSPEYVRRYVKSQRNDIETRKRLPKRQQHQLCDC